MWEFLMRITVLAHFATWLACPLPTVQFTYLFPLPRGLKEPAKRFNWNGVSNGICSNSTWFIYQFDFDFVAFYRTRWFSPLYHSHIPFAFAFPVIAFNCTLLVCFESLRHRLSRPRLLYRLLRFFYLLRLFRPLFGLLLLLPSFDLFNISSIEKNGTY